LGPLAFEETKDGMNQEKYGVLKSVQFSTMQSYNTQKIHVRSIERECTISFLDCLKTKSLKIENRPEGTLQKNIAQRCIRLKRIHMAKRNYKNI